MLRRLVLASILGGIPATALAQPVQVPGTIRSGVTLVPVDVRVLDKDGRPITDLTEDDFTLVENGVVQTIRQFERQAMSAEAAPAGIAPALASVADPEAGPQKHRTFLIVLGRGRLQHPARGVDAMIRFVREQLLPQDHVAVMAWNRATDFTTDHAAVAEVLERFRREHEAVESKLHFVRSGLAGLYGGKAVPPGTQSRIDAVFAGRVDFRTVPPGRVTDAGRIAEDARSVTSQLLGDVTSSAVRPEGGDMSLDEHIDASNQTSSDLENLYTGIEYLRYIGGEKRLVFVTQRGLFLPRLEDDLSLAAMANDARVVLDTVQTGGIGSGPPRTGRGAVPPGPTFTETFALQSLRTMSELSGGVSSVYGYADKAMDRIDRASRFQYLLAYAPADANLDGRYRRITVRVNRPGATVQYRRGYYARAQLVPYDRREFLTYSRVMAAALYPQPILDIRLRLRVRTERLDEGVETLADVRIDLGRVKFEARGDGKLHAQLDVSLYTANANGRGIGEMYRKLNLAYTPDEHARALKDGMNYTLRLRTGVKPRMVKVVVYDYAGDVIGTAESQVY
jgi:VWFA-related protein